MTECLFDRGLRIRSARPMDEADGKIGVTELNAGKHRIHLFHIPISAHDSRVSRKPQAAETCISALITLILPAYNTPDLDALPGRSLAVG